MSEEKIMYCESNTIATEIRLFQICLFTAQIIEPFVLSVHYAVAQPREFSGSKHTLFINDYIHWLYDLSMSDNRVPKVVLRHGTRLSDIERS